MKKILLLLAAMTAMCVQAEDYLYIEDFEIDRETLQAKVPLKAGRTCLQCVNYPCFDGIENLESDFANEGCHAFRKREEEK